jgi:hypothetical protein
MTTRKSVSRRAGDVAGSSFFSRAVTLSNTVDDSQKFAMYGNCPQETYEWRTWTGAENICVVCIRFPLQGVH